MEERGGVRRMWRKEKGGGRREKGEGKGAPWNDPYPLRGVVSPASQWLPPDRSIVPSSGLIARGMGRRERKGEEGKKWEDREERGRGRGKGRRDRKAFQ